MDLKQGATLSNTGSRADQLQFLRFLAFLNVFICHGEYWNFFHYPASHSGTFAVSFFFMLSGVVTGYSRFGRETPPSLRNIRQDMWKKVTKLYPLYIFVILAMVMNAGIPRMMAAGDRAGLLLQLKEFAHNALMIQSWPGCGGTLWFVSTIMFLYLWNLPALWLIRRARDHKFRYVIWGGAFLGLMVAVVVYCRLTRNTQMSYWHYLFPPARLSEYLGGMLLGYAIRDFKGQKFLALIPKLVYTLAEIAALAFWFFSLRRAGNYWMNHIVSWLIPNTVLLTVFLFGMGHISDLFRKKPLVYLGGIAYECYILHQTIIQRFLGFNPESVETAATQAFAFFYCLLLSVAMAALFHNVAGSRKNPGK